MTADTFIGIRKHSGNFIRKEATKPSTRQNSLSIFCVCLWQERRSHGGSGGSLNPPMYGMFGPHPAYSIGYGRPYQYLSGPPRYYMTPRPRSRSWAYGKGGTWTPKVSLGTAMHYLSTPCRWASLEIALLLFQGWHAHRVGDLRPSSTCSDTPRRTPMV
jgi:hypothetical protein